MNTRRGFVWRAGLVLTLASVLTSRSVADGELDLGFSPRPELGTNYISGFTVVGGQAYLSSPTFPVLRLRNDGSLDPDWQLPVPVTWMSTLGPLPSGGLAVLSNSGLLLQHDDGSYSQSGPLGISPLFQGALIGQDDGSVTAFDQTNARKVDGDGSIDPGFRIKVPLPAVDTSTSSGSGSLSIQAAGDRQGRYIVIGNFHASAPADRLGLLRLLADGSLDPTWNPSPDLGLRLSDSGRLNSQPVSVATLPDDSAVVALEDQLAWIDAQGTVTRRMPNLSNFPLNLAPLLMQPDGKAIVGGNFTSWGASPASGLIRLNADGTLDDTFTVQLDGPLVSAMELDSQGRLWISGDFRKVNGVARPGIARLQAYTPESTNTVALQANITAAPRHVATNEALYLTARVDGTPEPTLQWLRDGTPITGATNRGLRLAITNGSELGDFSLVLSNAFGSQKLEFPSVNLAARSPQPGTEDLAFSRALTNFIYVTHLVPLPDGRILVGSGNPYDNDTSETALVGRLLPDGSLDSGFGVGGVVKGQGHVETLVPLPGGGLLVTGDFTELAGNPAYGLAELDRSGNLVVRPFPSLDIVQVSTALPLPDGKLLIAGPFTKVGDAPAFRLARLNADLTLDTTFQSPVVAPRFVDAMALDLHGRVLIAGERTYGTGQILTNPPSLGLMRLLADGSADPAFQARTIGVRHIFVESDGKLLVGMPAFRLDEDGNVLTVFDDSYPYSRSTADFFLLDGPNHLMVRTSGGQVIYRSLVDNFISSTVELWRWKTTGERDYSFKCVLPSAGGYSYEATAMAALADDSVLLHTVLNESFDLELSRHLHRIPRDSDFSLRTKDVSAGQFRVALETQPGLTYEIYQREQLTGGTPTQIGVYTGDGYVIDLQTPANGDSTYLELRRH